MRSENEIRALHEKVDLTDSEHRKLTLEQDVALLGFFCALDWVLGYAHSDGKENGGKAIEALIKLEDSVRED